LIPVLFFQRIYFGEFFIFHRLESIIADKAAAVSKMVCIVN